jgi:hypothetical protein
VAALIGAEAATLGDAAVQIGVRVSALDEAVTLSDGEAMATIGRRRRVARWQRHRSQEPHAFLPALVTFCS